MSNSKPSILMILQLPPPMHGSAMSNQMVWDSTLLQQAFDLELMRMDFVHVLSDVGKFRPYKIWRALLMFRQLRQRLKTRRFDAAYFTLSPIGFAFLRDALLIFLLKRHGVQQIYHLRGKGIATAYRKQRTLRALYHWVFRDAKVIHSSSLLLYDIDAVCDISKVYIVPNGRADPGASRVASLQNPSGVPMILYLSNMIETKGPAVLLEALARLRERELAFMAVFAGPWHTEEFRNVFETAVRALQLENHVRYIGAVYGDDKANCFQSADIFAFPTFYPFECFPGAVVEAMSHGLPVVSTTEAAIPDIVVEGVTGLLVPSQHPAKLALALEKLVLDKKLRHSMGTAGRERFIAHYTLPATEARLRDVLRQCLS